MRLLPLLFLLIIPGIAVSNDNLVGVWENSETNMRLDILDGFKPNRGAVLTISNGTNTDIGIWEIRDSEIRLIIGYYNREVKNLDEDGFQWNGIPFKKQHEINEDEIIVLRRDESGFIDRLTGNVWLTSNEGRTSVFKSTFSIDSGVVETFSSEGELHSLESWGVSSGVLKIGGNVIVEARMSQSYMMGLDERDNFFVLKAISPLSVHSRTDLERQRFEFLKLLVTDVWQRTRYNEKRDYKFRPIEGPLKGRRVRLLNDKLEASDTWEYSPSTGALKIGYTEYIGGVVIDDTLALVVEDGDQTFYRRIPSGSGREFTVSDVRKTPINETHEGICPPFCPDNFRTASVCILFNSMRTAERDTCTSGGRNRFPSLVISFLATSSERRPLYSKWKTF